MCYKALNTGELVPFCVILDSLYGEICVQNGASALIWLCYLSF